MGLSLRWEQTAEEIGRVYLAGVSNGHEVNMGENRKRGS